MFLIWTFVALKFYDYGNVMSEWDRKASKARTQSNVSTKEGKSTRSGGGGGKGGGASPKAAGSSGSSGNMGTSEAPPAFGDIGGMGSDDDYGTSNERGARAGTFDEPADPFSEI